MKVSKRIEKDIKKAFPGWEGKVIIGKETWSFKTTSNVDFYHLYEGVTKDEADRLIIDDIMKIIKKYDPYAGPIDARSEK